MSLTLAEISGKISMCQAPAGLFKGYRSLTETALPATGYSQRPIDEAELAPRAAVALHFRPRP